MAVAELLSGLTPNFSDGHTEVSDIIIDSETFETHQIQELMSYRLARSARYRERGCVPKPFRNRWQKLVLFFYMHRISAQSSECNQTTNNAVSFQHIRGKDRSQYQI